VNINMPDVLRIQPRFIGNGADDVAGHDVMLVSRPH
jgi:hypothetical protein